MAPNNPTMFRNRRDDYLEEKQNQKPLPAESREYPEKEYFCRNIGCDRRTWSKRLPTGWYIVSVSQGDEYSLKTVAMVCSLECLVKDTINETFARLHVATRSY